MQEWKKVKTKVSIPAAKYPAPRWSCDHLLWPSGRRSLPLEKGLPDLFGRRMKSQGGLRGWSQHLPGAFGEASASLCDITWGDLQTCPSENSLAVLLSSPPETSHSLQMLPHDQSPCCLISFFFFFVFIYFNFRNGADRRMERSCGSTSPRPPPPFVSPAGPPGDLIFFFPKALSAGGVSFQRLCFFQIIFELAGVREAPPHLWFVNGRPDPPSTCEQQEGCPGLLSRLSAFCFFLFASV